MTERISYENAFKVLLLLFVAASIGYLSGVRHAEKETEKNLAVVRISINGATCTWTVEKGPVILK